MQARRFSSLGENFFLMLVYGAAAATLALNAATDPSHRFIAGMFAVFGMAATARVPEVARTLVNGSVPVDAADRAAV